MERNVNKQQILEELDQIINTPNPYSRNPLDDIMDEEDDEEVE